MKKVDDVKLLEMLRDGIEQKQIAAHFGCAPSYITKRKKQLLPTKAVEPETFSSLTEPQKRFCLAKIQGATNIAAVQSAYETTTPESAKSMGTVLMKNTAIQASIAELLEEQGLGRRQRVKKLISHVENIDPALSLRALTEAMKIGDDYPASKNFNITANVDISPVDLSRYKGKGDVVSARRDN